MAFMPKWCNTNAIILLGILYPHAGDETSLSLDYNSVLFPNLAPESDDLKLWPVFDRAALQGARLVLAKQKRMTF